MDFSSALENIYISPLETCNLNCHLCYTNKTKNILTNQQILSFVKRYQKCLNSFSPPSSRGELKGGLVLKSILFCGGEVFTLKNFPRLVNKLLSQHIFISIITNGTIDCLESIKDPKNCQLLVSFDGPKDIHDHNRGYGNFDKSVKFVHSALQKGFPVEIMYLVTPQSYPFIDSFNLFNLKNNYITQKTYFYTANHPLSNQKNAAPALTPQQIINLKKNYFSIPSKNFGCQELSLQSDGQIYGCCESPYPLAKISDKIPVIIKKFQESLLPCQKCGQCLGCCAPNFLCGYKNELGVKSCQQVIKLMI
jgi:sulfatase maturation enzyme AslB (radical SAM superfamily)